jgi:hypothetical protein
MMRGMMSCLSGLLLVSVCVAQEAPAVDLKDPAAVAQAYAKACRDADLKAVLELLAPDDPSRPRLQEMSAHGDPRETQASVGGMLQGYLFLPLGVEVDHKPAGTSQEGDRAEVKLTATSEVVQTFVLARQPDGTWRVRLLDSLRASAPDGNSMLALNLDPAAAEGRGGDRTTYESQEHLRQLYQAIAAYATDHGNRLPPAEQWTDELEPYALDRSILKCPLPDGECSYAMNADLPKGALWDDWNVRQATALLFEWTGKDRNAHASAKDLTKITSPRADGLIVLVTAGGETLVLKPGEKLGGWQETETQNRSCSDHLRALVEAARKYAIAHGGLLPKAESWESDIEPYLRVQIALQGPPAERWRSRDHLQALYKALVEYSKDHDDRLPRADSWVDEIQPYLLDAENLKCPAVPDLECGYAMNEALSGQPLPGDWQVRRGLLVLFEWAGGERNAHTSQDAGLAGKRLQPDGILVAMNANGDGVMLPPETTLDELLAADGDRQTCMQNLMKLAEAARKYARDNGGTLPGADSWQEDLAPYLIDAPNPNALVVCPAAPDLDYGYAINQEVAGRNLAEFRGRGNIVLFFESDLNQPNASGPPTLDGPGRRRHTDYWSAAEGRFDNVVYVNGDGGQGPTQPVAVAGEGAESVLARVLTCPAAPELKRAYAINAQVAGRNATELTDHGRTVLFFESDLGVPNAAGDPEKDGVAGGRHQGGRNDPNRYNHVGYLNGSTSQTLVTQVRRVEGEPVRQ